MKQQTVMPTIDRLTAILKQRMDSKLVRIDRHGIIKHDYVCYKVKQYEAGQAVRIWITLPSQRIRHITDADGEPLYFKEISETEWRL